MSDCLIKYEWELHVFAFENCIFWFVISLQKWLSHFLLIKIKNVLSKKNDVIFHHFDPIKGFKGTFVNRIFPSLHSRLLEIKLTVKIKLTD